MATPSLWYFRVKIHKWQIPALGSAEGKLGILHMQPLALVTVATLSNIHRGPSEQQDSYGHMASSLNPMARYVEDPLLNHQQIL